MAKSASVQKHEEYIQPAAADTYLDHRGREKPDPTPIAPPIGYKRQPSLHEQIRQMVRSEKLAMEAAAQGYETFDEADDFDVGDDIDPSSPYEEQFEGDLLPPPPPSETPGAPPAPAGGSAGVPTPGDTPSA